MVKVKYWDILQEVEKEHEQNIDNTRNSRVLIVDGLNTFIRCWSSIPTMNDDGEHVAGVTCPLRSIGYAIKQVKPTRVIVVFDGKGGSNSRKKIFNGYKEGREKNKLRVNRQYEDMMTEEDEQESMKRQYVWLFGLLHNLPVTTMMYDGVEADDVMAYLTTNVLGEDEQAVLMSTDKDFLQLVNHKTLVWSPTKKILYNTVRVKEEYGIESKNLLLFRMMDGDNSDKIPGVKGCGLKTVHKRIPEICGEEKLSLDDFMNIVEEKQSNSKIKIYKTLMESKEQLELNFRLMQLEDVEMSGNIKMNILSRYDEPTKALSRHEFFTTCAKYKVLNNFGKNVDGWLRETFGSLIAT